MSIELRGVTKRFGDVVALHATDLWVAEGEMLVLLGPSGCGKSTTLRMVAGLEVPTAGEVRIGGQDVTRVAPKDRDVAMVFQSYALYPHLTVRENLAFPLDRRGVGRTERDGRVLATARRLGLERLLDRKPGELSGGERQRVAMGRALVRAPKVFLFDEPLSNLDARLRVELRGEVARLHRETGATSLYVTHDQVEAMALGDRIAVMGDARVQQIGSPEAIYRRPANRFVATFVGAPSMNVLPAAKSADGIVAGPLSLPAAFDPEGADVGIRPEDLEVVAATDGANAEVERIEPLGVETHAYLAAGDARLVARLGPTTTLRAGDRVRVAADPARVHVFDRATGARREPG